MKKVGTTYWITGLSGAGKTTIGKLLHDYISKSKDNVVLLDGDEIRDVFQDYTYTEDGRIKLTYKYSRLCKMLNKQGIDVIICCVSMYDECREWNRKEIENYREIYLDVPIEELIIRDQKQLYSRALKCEIENVMGVNMEYQVPKHPDLVINNSGENTPEIVVDIIIKTMNL